MHVLKRLKNSEKHTIRCEVCEEFKTEAEFVAKHTGKFRVCKECKTHINRLTRYHVHPDDYQALLEKQQNRCAICECELKLERNLSVIDHCHISDQVRGVLCRECNSGLGQFKDNANALTKAIDYLKKPPAVGVVASVKIREKYQYIREYMRAKRCGTPSSK